MSDNTPEATETEAAETQPNELPADHPLVKTLSAQKATIKELKAKVARFDEFEESTKSEAEKAADRISKAEAEAASVPAKVADALRAHLVALHGIDAEDAELFLTAAEPDLLLKQVDRLVGQSDKRQKRNHVPREGTSESPGDGDAREAVRAIFG